MKKNYIIFVSLLLTLNFICCSSAPYTVSSNGDKADVELKNGGTFTAELISISDTAVFFYTLPDEVNKAKFLYANIDDIKSISVLGYSGKGWIAPVLLFQILPALIIGAVAATFDEGGFGVVLGAFALIPGSVTALLFASTNGDTPQWDDSMILQELKELNIYCRYPEALTQDDLNRLLSLYSKTSISKYGGH